MSNKELKFSMERQLHSNWCWAANSASISKFYNNLSNWNQCQVVGTCLSLSDCCKQNMPPQCDVPYYLDRALNVTGNLNNFIQNQLLQNQIISEIDGGWVIGIRIGWRNGGGHFISLYGYNDDLVNELYVYTADPINGKIYQKLNDLALNYLQVGQWTHTYLTKAPTNMLQFTNINKDLLERARKLAPPNLFISDKHIDFINKDMLEETMAHDIYTIDYDSLKGASSPKVLKNGVRLMDSNKLGENFIFEFNNANNDAVLRQIIFDDEYTANYKRALTSIKESLKRTETVYNVGVIRLPEFKVDAIWLHTSESIKSDDIIFPLFTNDFLNSYNNYRGDVFLSLLQKKVRESKPYEDNELGG